MEQIVIVDKTGKVKRYTYKKELSNGENTAVELVLVYILAAKQIVLFNRAYGASDMHDHWALQSGKVNSGDLTLPIEGLVGNKLPVAAYKNAAIREFTEELGFALTADDLQFVTEFHMPSKQIYFTLLSLALDEADLDKLSPDQLEVDEARRFTIEEFEHNLDLGDALVYRKDLIVDYMRGLFGDPT